MSRKKLEKDEDFLNVEPYKSIINILMIAPRYNSIYNKGLQTKELRDLIIKNYSIYKEKADEDRLKILFEFKQFLTLNAINRVKLGSGAYSCGALVMVQIVWHSFLFCINIYE